MGKGTGKGSAKKREKIAGGFSRAELLAGLKRLSSVSMVVVGDAIIDRYIWGNVERISPEAPVPVLDVARAEDRLGGAANVAHNLARLGITVSLASVIGDDQEAESLRELLKDQGIGTRLLVVDRSRCTTVKTRVMAGQQQIVRIDHEQRHAIGKAGEKALIAGVVPGGKSELTSSAPGIVVSDYGKGVVTTDLLAAVAGVVERGGCVMVDPHPSNYARYTRLGMCKPNRKEAENATGIKITDNPTAAKAARALLSAWGCHTVVLSLGGGGVCIVESDAASGTVPAKAGGLLTESRLPPPIFLPTKARQVFDVSGAGDTLVAVFSAAKQAGLSTGLAGELANIASGVVVSQVGTVPITLAALTEEINQLGL